MSNKAKSAYENSRPVKTKVHKRVDKVDARVDAKTKDILVDITEKEYRADLARGLREDEVLKPGRHRFKRGGFLARHGRKSGQAPPPIKVRVPIDLDLDVLNYFRRRAAAPNVLSYQRQINNTLRAAMEREEGPACQVPSVQAEALLADQRFIEAVAQRVRGRRSLKRKRQRRAA